MVVVDTHALIWWTERLPDLSQRARELLNQSNEVVIPAVVAWEVAMLEHRGKIEVDGGALAYIQRAARLSGVRLHPLTPSIAVRAAQLDDSMPRDPADRMIAATAIELGAPLITRDRRVSASGVVEVVW